jgi:hypothetical protein
MNTAMLSTAFRTALKLTRLGSAGSRLRASDNRVPSSVFAGAGAQRCLCAVTAARDELARSTTEPSRRSVVEHT